MPGVCKMHRLWCCDIEVLNFGLAKEQLDPIGPSQALTDCYDAVVDKFHLYGDVCIIDDNR